MRGSIRLFLLCVAAAALVLPATSAIGLEPLFKVRASSDKDGPFHVIDEMHVGVDKTKSAYFRVKSSDDEDLHGMMFGDGGTTSPNPEGFTVRWFKGDKNITGDVKDAGFEFTIRSDKPTLFRAQVKHVESGGGFCMQGVVTGEPGGASAAMGVNHECKF